MYPAYKLNRQGDKVQTWCTPFPVLNQSLVPCLVLNVASWPTYWFLRREIRWSGTLISLRISHSLLWSTQSKASVQSMKQCMSAQLIQLCPTLCNPTDCNPPGSPVHGIFPARILQWVAMPSSSVTSWPRDWTRVSCVSSIIGGRWFFWNSLAFSMSRWMVAVWSLVPLPLWNLAYTSGNPMQI